MSASSAIPAPTSTLEKHGVRGVTGPNILAQTIFLDRRHSAIGIRLVSSRYSEEEKLGFKLEFSILGSLLGDYIDPRRGKLEDLIPIYRRTFADWLQIAISEHNRFPRPIIEQQLANA
jgi:hypothetical protein